MTIFSVSSNYLASALLPAVQQTQAELAQLEVESSTGQYADLGLQLGGENGYELSLRSQDDLLQAMTSANGVIGMNLTTAQGALTSIHSAADDAAKSLIGLESGGGSASALQTLGQNQLQQLISLGNTTSGDTYVFGGQNTGVPPLNDYYAQPSSTAKTAIDKAFQSYFGFSITSPQTANITATQMQGFLSGPFASQFQEPNWGSNWSNASSQNTSAEISPGNTVDTSTNANTAGFQQLAQGYTMLSELGNIGLSASAEQTVSSAALSAINQGASSLTNTQAELGATQSAVKQANSDMSNQMTVLQKQVGNLDDVNPAQVATELTTLTTQLETAYQVTAKIQSMNLAQYLPT